MSAPSAAGVHSAMFTPFGTNRNAMRTGVVGAEAAANDMRSSAGSAIIAPMPRRKVFRSRCIIVLFV